MKKCFILVFILVILSSIFSVLSINSSAIGTVQMFWDYPYLTFNVADDSDDGFEYFQLRVAVGSPYNGFRAVETWTLSDLVAIGYAYVVPDSVLSAVNSGSSYFYQFVGYTADSSYAAPYILLTSRVPQSSEIVLQQESPTLISWTSPFIPGSVTYSVTLTNGTRSQTYQTIQKYFQIDNTWHDGFGIYLGNDITVTVSVLSNGVSYVSNPLIITAVPEATYSVDTDLIYVDPRIDEATYYDPSDYVDLMYSGVTKTPVYKYVFSGLVSCLTMCGLVFIIRWVH